jgi:Na+/H+-dicarboxylate symporter
VPRAAIIVIAATLPLFGLPVEGVVVLLASDQFIDMGTTATNVVGNCVAAAVIAKWEGALEPWRGHAHPLVEGFPAMRQDELHTTITDRSPSESPTTTRA